MSDLAYAVLVFVFPTVGALAASFFAISPIARHVLRWPALASLVFLAVTTIYAFMCTRTDWSIYGTYYNCFLLSERLGYHLVYQELHYLIAYMIGGPAAVILAAVAETDARFRKSH